MNKNTRLWELCGLVVSGKVKVKPSLGWNKQTPQYVLRNKYGAEEPVLKIMLE